MSSASADQNNYLLKRQRQDRYEILPAGCNTGLSDTRLTFAPFYLPVAHNPPTSWQSLGPACEGILQIGDPEPSPSPSALGSCLYPDGLQLCRPEHRFYPGSAFRVHAQLRLAIAYRKLFVAHHP
jgi:hypothetical protein